MCVQLHLPASHYLSMGDFQLCSAMSPPCAWACSSRGSCGHTAAVPAVLSSCPESSWPPKPVSNVTKGWWVLEAPRCYLGNGVPGGASRWGPAVLGMAEESWFTHSQVPQENFSSAPYQTGRRTKWNPGSLSHQNCHGKWEHLLSQKIVTQSVANGSPGPFQALLPVK